MSQQSIPSERPTGSFPLPVLASGEEPLFSKGEAVRVRNRKPIGHYRVPQYLRGRTGVIERLIPERSMNNEEEGFGRNAGAKRHYYRMAVPMHDIWDDYRGSANDALFIEVFETWLERVPS